METQKIVNRSTGEQAILLSKEFLKRAKTYEFRIQTVENIESFYGRCLQDIGFVEFQEITVYTEIRVIYENCVIGHERIDHRHDDDTERYVEITKNFAIEIEYTMERVPVWDNVQKNFRPITREISSKIIKDHRPK